MVIQSPLGVGRYVLTSSRVHAPQYVRSATRRRRGPWGHGERTARGAGGARGVGGGRETGTREQTEKSHGGSESGHGAGTRERVASRRAAKRERKGTKGRDRDSSSVDCGVRRSCVIPCFEKHLSCRDRTEGERYCSAYVGSTLVATKLRCDDPRSIRIRYKRSSLRRRDRCPI